MMLVIKIDVVLLCWSVHFVLHATAATTTTTVQHTMFVRHTYTRDRSHTNAIISPYMPNSKDGRALCVVYSYVYAIASQKYNEPTTPYVVLLIPAADE